MVDVLDMLWTSRVGDEASPYQIKDEDERRRVQARTREALPWREGLPLLLPALLAYMTLTAGTSWRCTRGGYTGSGYPLPSDYHSSGFGYQTGLGLLASTSLVHIDPRPSRQQYVPNN